MISSASRAYYISYYWMQIASYVTQLLFLMSSSDDSEDILVNAVYSGVYAVMYIRALKDIMQLTFGIEHDIIIRQIKVKANSCCIWY